MIKELGVYAKALAAIAVGLAVFGAYKVGLIDLNVTQTIVLQLIATTVAVFGGR